MSCLSDVSALERRFVVSSSTCVSTGVALRTQHATASAALRSYGFRPLCLSAMSFVSSAVPLPVDVNDSVSVHDSALLLLSDSEAAAPRKRRRLHEADGTQHSDDRKDGKREGRLDREVIVLSSDSEGGGGGGADSDEADGDGRLARFVAGRALSADDDDCVHVRLSAGRVPSAKQRKQRRRHDRAGATAALVAAGRRALSAGPTQRRQFRSRSEERSSAVIAAPSRPLSARRPGGAGGGGGSGAGGGGWSASFRCEDGRLFPLSVLRVSTEGVRHVIFVDGDNWPRFLLALPSAMDDDTLVCCFVGGHTQMRVPNDALRLSSHPASSSSSTTHSHPHSLSPAAVSPHPSLSLSPCARLVESGRLLVTQCGCTPNAADFAMAVKVGALHFQLPLHIPFTLLSGDKGLDEVVRHTAGRSCSRLNPHAEHVRGEKRHTDELNFALLQSITQR